MSQEKSTPPQKPRPEEAAPPTRLEDAALDAVTGGISAGFSPAPKAPTERSNSTDSGAMIP